MRLLAGKARPGCERWKRSCRFYLLPGRSTRRLVFVANDILAVDHDSSKRRPSSRMPHRSEDVGESYREKTKAGSGPAFLVDPLIMTLLHRRQKPEDRIHHSPRKHSPRKHCKHDMKPSPIQIYETAASGGTCDNSTRSENQIQSRDAFAKRSLVRRGHVEYQIPACSKFLKGNMPAIELPAI